MITKETLLQIVKPLFISSVHRRPIKGRTQNDKIAQNILLCQIKGIFFLKREIKKNRLAIPKHIPLMLLLKGTVITDKKNAKYPTRKYLSVILRKQ